MYNRVIKELLNYTLKIIHCIIILIVLDCLIIVYDILNILLIYNLENRIYTLYILIKPLLTLILHFVN